jgi:hypothetical protein
VVVDFLLSFSIVGLALSEDANRLETFSISFWRVLKLRVEVDVVVVVGAVFVCFGSLTGSIGERTSGFLGFSSKNGPFSGSVLNVNEKLSLVVCPGVANDENVMFVVSSSLFSPLVAF